MQICRTPQVSRNGYRFLNLGAVRRSSADGERNDWPINKLGNTWHLAGSNGRSPNTSYAAVQAVQAGEPAEEPNQTGGMSLNNSPSEPKAPLPLPTAGVAEQTVCVEADIPAGLTLDLSQTTCRFRRLPVSSYSDSVTLGYQHAMCCEHCIRGQCFLGADINA